jgi:hypothetical protein
MKRTNKQTAPQDDPCAPTPDDASPTGRRLCWEDFFRCQRSPVLRSQLLTALMAGTPLVVDRLPSASLLDVVLLATAARNHCDAEIVDDYAALLQRARDEWAAPGWTALVFDQQHGNKANYILQGSDWFDNHEESYIPDMVAWYLRQTDAPAVFERKIEMMEKKPVRRETAPRSATRKKAA